MRAVRDGKLPPVSEKQARKGGWFEVVEDIIGTMPEKKNGIAPWMYERLKADGIDWRSIDKPLYVMGSGNAVSSEREAALRDAVVDKMRKAGIDVSMNAEEGQRVQDMANGHGEDMRFMGSRVRKKMNEIGQHFSDKPLTPEEKAIVSVFSGEKDRVSFNAQTKDGTTKIEMQQGNENHAGSKHSVYRHYNTRSNYFTTDEILLIPNIIQNGERNQKGKSVLYTIEKGKVRYTVLTERTNGKEVFQNFISLHCRHPR